MIASSKIAINNHNSLEKPVLTYETSGKPEAGCDGFELEIDEFLVLICMS